MTTHLTARLAWHDDGWNGHICQNPVHNTHCVGPYSYPGEMIAERRDLEMEMLPENRGCAISKAGVIPPCIYSANAFGAERLTAFSDPPEFFRDDTQQKRWELPPSTVCIWPYEEMYKEGMKSGGRYDYDRRLAEARAYFAEIEQDQSLISYYANYSNPFSEDDKRQYVLIGLSRVKKVGDEPAILILNIRI